MSIAPSDQSEPLTRCRPRVDQLIWETVADTLLERSRVASEDGDFQSVLAATVARFEDLASELALAGQQCQLLTMILSYLELSYFAKLGWGTMTHNDAEPPSWTFQRLFEELAIDIPFQTGRLNWIDKCAIPAPVASFISRFESKHGRFGVQVLITSFTQFLDRHAKSTETDVTSVTVISIRGGHAGSNDGYLAELFCSEVREWAFCVALQIDDVLAFDSLSTGSTGTKRLATRARELLDAGRIEAAARWLDLRVCGRDLGSPLCEDSIMNLRILAARRLGDREALLWHLTAAYKNTFQPEFFAAILDLFPSTGADIARSYLIEIAEAARYDVASAAFKLLVDQKEWSSLERLQAHYRGREESLVSPVYNLKYLADLIQSCQVNAPLVASHLQKLYENRMRSRRRRQ